METEELIKRKNALVIASNDVYGAMQRIEDACHDMNAIMEFDSTSAAGVKQALFEARTCLASVDEELAKMLAEAYIQLEQEE